MLPLQCLYFALLLTGLQLYAQKIDPVAVRALEAYRSGDCAAAVTQLEQVTVEERPMLPLARCYLELGQFGKAAEAIQAYRQKDPADESSAILLAQAEVGQKRVAEAAQLLEKLSAAAPDSLALKTGLAWVYARAGRSADAAKLLAAVIAVDSADPAALLGLGDLAARTSDWKAAADYFGKALAVIPSNAAALQGIATAHLRQNNIREAIPFLERASLVRPADWELNKLMADTYRQAGKWPELIKAVEFTSLGHGEDETITAWLVEAFRNTAEVSRSEKYYRALLAKAPSNFLARITLADMLYDAKRPKEAKPEYLYALKLRSDLPIVSDRLGQMAAEDGQAAEALQYYAMACRSASATVPMRMRLARAYFESGDMAGSRLALEQVVKVDAVNREAKVMLLQLAIKTQQQDEATRWAAELLPGDQDNPDLLRILAEAAIRKSEFPQAAEYLEKILKVRPADRALRFQLVGIYNNLGAPEQLQRTRNLLTEYIGTSPDDAEGYLLLANTCRRTADTTCAQENFERGFQRMPPQPPATLAWAYNSYALFLSGENKFEEATMFLSKAVELDPKDDQAMYNLAQIYIKLRRKDDLAVLREKLSAMASSHLAELDVLIEKSQINAPRRQPARRD